MSFPGSSVCEAGCHYAVCLRTSLHMVVVSLCLHRLFGTLPQHKWMTVAQFFVGQINRSQNRLYFCFLFVF